MIRRLMLTCLLLLPCVTHAQDATHTQDSAKTMAAFSAVCSAAMDQKPEILAIATSQDLQPVGGIKNAVTIGNMSFWNFSSPQTKQAVFIVTTTYADAMETECQSSVPGPAVRGDLENLAHSLNLDGGFLPTNASVILSRWKRPGVQPLVLVTMTSNAVTTVLKMQRVDVTGKK